MTDFTLPAQIEADSVFLRDLPLSQLRLQNQSAVPWLILVPRRDVTEMHDLDAEDRQQLMSEMMQVSEVMTKLFAPHKINIGALGNYVPQLHVHIIGRFRNDPVWPQPVWGKLPASPYAPEKLEAIKQKLNDLRLWR